jgi:hypothetical protein
MSTTIIGIGTFVPIDTPYMGHYISGGLDEWAAGVGIVTDNFNTIFGWIESVPGLGYVIENLIDFTHIDEFMNAFGIFGDALGWAADAIYPFEQYIFDPIIRQQAYAMTGYHEMTREELQAVQNIAFGIGNRGPLQSVNDILGDMLAEDRYDRGIDDEGNPVEYVAPPNVYVNLDVDAVNAGQTPLTLATM